jgi:hypothetical protein
MVDCSKAGRRLGSLLALLLVAIPWGVVKGEGATDLAAPSLFAPSGDCLACHNSLVTPRGEDVSIGTDWRASMMANAARDPYWQAAVRREMIDHPESAAAIENECAACHMPMSRYEMNAGGSLETVFGRLHRGAQTRRDILAMDGVSCTMCHQISDAGLGEESSFTAGFTIAGVTDRVRPIFGPFEVDQGRQRIMSSATGFTPAATEHLGSSAMCATCHTLFTHALGAGGEAVGELPEQVPFLEWKHSSHYGTRECVSCHMAVVEGNVEITSVMGQPRARIHQHVFRGGNAFMMRILNRYRDELGVTASPMEMDRAIARTTDHLRSAAAELRVSWPEMIAGRLEFVVTVRNLTGHKLPTAYPSRRVWLHATVRDAGGNVVFESGAVNADGSIVGNANDMHPGALEPHHRTISEPGQVQIWETILADEQGRITTGLLSAVRFLKDNRILPDGFDKGTAGTDVAVHGEAVEDEDFVGGSDQVQFAISLDGTGAPYSVDVKLLYQPISFRWAMNLREFDAAETSRFVRYYDEMSEHSWVILARARSE